MEGLCRRRTVCSKTKGRLVFFFSFLPVFVRIKLRFEAAVRIWFGQADWIRAVGAGKGEGGAAADARGQRQLLDEKITFGPQQHMY